MEQHLTHFAVEILCDDLTGLDEVDNYFATDADTMLYIVYENDLDENKFRIYTFNMNILLNWLV